MAQLKLKVPFVEHELVSEAAVVGYPHDIKGQGIYAYVTTNTGVEVNEDLKKELIQWIRKKIGPIATPDKLQFSQGLPKTRSGKIMRRILRKIASKEEDQLGDTSTLADPNVVQSLIDGSKISNQSDISNLFNSIDRVEQGKTIDNVIDRYPKIKRNFLFLVIQEYYRNYENFNHILLNYTHKKTPNKISRLLKISLTSNFFSKNPIML